MILILNKDAFQNDLLKSCFESICFTGFFEIFMGGGGGWGRGQEGMMLICYKIIRRVHQVIIQNKCIILYPPSLCES